MTTFRNATESWRWRAKDVRWIATWVATWVVTLGATPLWAAPNLVANGELSFPRKLAPVRVSATGDTAIFEFSRDRSFGRVIAHGKGLGDQLAEELKVGYSSISNASGRMYGLVIDAGNVKANTPYQIAIWFDLKGIIRSERQYAYSVVSLLISAQSASSALTLKMIAPAVWADGKFVGANVDLVWDPNDKDSQPAKNGAVRMIKFKQITGGQFLILELPTNFKSQLFLEHVSLREIDEELIAGKKTRMPTPTRYVEIENPLERRIADLIESVTKALKDIIDHRNAPNWGNSIEATALLLDALATTGEDLGSKKMHKVVQWLADQEPKTVPEVAARLMFFARFSDGKHRQQIARDLMWLEDAQFEDGGWAGVSVEGKDGKKNRQIHPDNLYTIQVCTALREASYAGFETSRQMWLKAARYWTSAQAHDGGFRVGLSAYGGLGEAPTIRMTAIGVTGMYLTLDMAFAAGGTRCEQYRANRAQVDGIRRGQQWLAENYGEHYKTVGSLADGPQTNSRNSRLASYGLNQLIEVSGITRFHGHDAFRRSSRDVFKFTDPNTGFFLGQPSAETGELFSSLVLGAAPPVFQRIVAGGNSAHEMSRDAYHLVRYLRREHHKLYNWRQANIEQPIVDLARVPMMMVHVVGEIKWDKPQWRKIRDYCFSGGVVVFNIAGDAADQRSKVEAGLKIAFPEYAIKPLDSKDSIFSNPHKVGKIKGIRTVGNGFKNLVFLLPDDWSCALNLYRVDDHPEVFEFLDNLFEYTLDGETPRRSFAPSPWNLEAATTQMLAVANMEVGSHTPAYPDRLATLDREMQSGYRLKIAEVPADGTTKPALLWLACRGGQPMTSAQKRTVLKRMREGTYVFAEVLSGNAAWAESFRAQLLKLDPELRLRRMLSSHAVLTGFIPETQGFDVREVALRSSLRKKFSKLPRVDIYVMELKGQEVGAFCTYDVSAGLGYMLYPDCRGLMPEDSRKLATNLVLHAMDLATRPSGRVARNSN